MRRDITEAEYREISAALPKAQDAGETLSDWEWDFVNAQTERLAQWGRDLRVSDKELDIIRRLAKRAAA